MDPARMLHQMCHDSLSEADVKAIRKARGFSSKETATRALLENFFLTPIGVRDALETLSAEEVTLLHCLQMTRAAVGVAFFARIYPTERCSYFDVTFTREYQEVFKRVQRSLVRKGLLLVAEECAASYGQTTRMERWRFCFPAEFDAFLLPLFPSARQLDGPGRVRAAALRSKVKEISSGAAAGAADADSYPWSLADGALHLGELPFSGEQLQAWQRSSWQQALVRASSLASLPSSVIDTLEYVFSQLPAGAWLQPPELNPVLRIFLEQEVDVHTVCAAGWQCGRLACQTLADAEYFRPAPQELAAPPGLQPASYLTQQGADAVVVDLDTVPYAALEELGPLARFTVSDGALLAAADIARLGRATDTLRQGPLAGWLRDTVPGFRQALAVVAGRWGKRIVHANLVLAKVTDLSLRVKIERVLKDQVVALPNGFLAFPPDFLSIVEQTVRQAGHVVKEIAPHD